MESTDFAELLRRQLANVEREKSGLFLEAQSGQSN